MKKITDLWPKECILCTTQEECDIIMDMMHDAGLRWRTGQSYKEHRPNNYLPNQCYHPYWWMHTETDFYISEWCIIYPASDFIEAKRQPKQGEWVLVSNHNYDDRVKRIFLCEVPQSACSYLCVLEWEESAYLAWETVTSVSWKQIKQLPNEVKSTYTIECTEEMYEKVKDLIYK